MAKKMFNHLLRTASKLNAKNVRVVSDPNAEGFYLKMGARKVGEKKSSIKGRMLPILQIDL
ncbi:MAG: GNAT family N-acetyltransferase [Candidatus Aenigmarchaeota archaeon]|nr:GNAT family N-acetyltransferase [Candidatus Aenigmarchaeota archaeon]